jgi:large subunit ribosomal protein L19
MNKMDVVNTMLKERAIDARKSKDGENFVEFPQFRAGDTVNVSVRVVEGEKERLQNFKGIVLSVRGEGLNKSFLVRKISNGIGVERIFMMHSPMLHSIEVIKQGRVRRSKLYYLRGMSEKKIRQKLS